MKPSQNCVCCGVQVVCEKGLGVDGMTLSSLKKEGFQAVFIGIGGSTLSVMSVCTIDSVFLHLVLISLFMYHSRSPSGQQSSDFSRFNCGSRLFLLKRLPASGGFCQQERYWWQNRGWKKRCGKTFTWLLCLVKGSLRHLISSFILLAFLHKNNNLFWTSFSLTYWGQTVIFAKTDVNKLFRL